MGFFKKVKKAVKSAAKVVAPVTNLFDGAKVPSLKDLEKKPFGTMTDMYSMVTNPLTHMVGEKFGIKGAGAGALGITLSNIAKGFDPKRGNVVDGGLPGGAPDPASAIDSAIQDEIGRSRRKTSTLLGGLRGGPAPLTARATLFGR